MLKESIRIVGVLAVASCGSTAPSDFGFGGSGGSGGAGGSGGSGGSAGVGGGGGGERTVDAGGPVDGGVTRDGGILRDGGVSRDGGVHRDGGVARDGGVEKRCGLPGASCEADEFCEFPVGQCNPPPGASGVCRKKGSGLCPDIYAPVCGCDDNTYYSGECESRAAGVNIQERG